MAANTAVELLERKGFWVKIRAANNEGWTKLSNISVDTKDAGGGGLAGLASGRSGSGNAVSTSGGRGLDDGPDLTKGTPDPAAVANLSRTAVNEEQAAKFAADSKLERRQIAYVAASGAKK